MSPILNPLFAKLIADALPIPSVAPVIITHYLSFAESLASFEL
jgi:hypothetical protein